MHETVIARLYQLQLSEEEPAAQSALLRPYDNISGWSRADEAYSRPFPDSGNKADVESKVCSPKECFSALESRMAPTRVWNAQPDNMTEAPPTLSTSNACPKTKSCAKNEKTTS